MPETEIAVHVNGRARRARVEPRLTLADFIRERCHLTGTHYVEGTNIAGTYMATYLREIPRPVRNCWSEIVSDGMA